MRQDLKKSMKIKAWAYCQSRDRTYWLLFTNLILCLFQTGFLQATQAVKIKFEIDKKSSQISISWTRQIKNHMQINRRLDCHNNWFWNVFQFLHAALTRIAMEMATVKLKFAYACQTMNMHLIVQFMDVSFLNSTVLLNTTQINWKKCSWTVF